MRTNVDGSARVTWTKTQGAATYGDELRGDIKLSQALRRAMRAHGYTQAQVSEKTGIRKETLSKILSGRRRPSAKMMLTIASAIGATVDEIIEGME